MELRIHMNWACQTSLFSFIPFPKALSRTDNFFLSSPISLPLCIPLSPLLVFKQAIFFLSTAGYKPRCGVIFWILDTYSVASYFTPLRSNRQGTRPWPSSRKVHMNENRGCRMWDPRTEFSIRKKPRRRIRLLFSVAKYVLNPRSHTPSRSLNPTKAKARARGMACVAAEGHINFVRWKPSWVGNGREIGIPDGRSGFESGNWERGGQKSFAFGYFFGRFVLIFPSDINCLPSLLLLFWFPQSCIHCRGIQQIMSFPLYHKNKLETPIPFRACGTAPASSYDSRKQFLAICLCAYAHVSSPAVFIDSHFQFLWPTVSPQPVIVLSRNYDRPKNIKRFRMKPIDRKWNWSWKRILPSLFFIFVRHVPCAMLNRAWWLLVLQGER